MPGRAPDWLNTLRQTAEWRDAHIARDDSGQVVTPDFLWAEAKEPSFARFVTWLGKQYGDRVAIADYSAARIGPRAPAPGPVTVTYRQLSQMVLARAAWLRDRGVGPWDHVAVCLPNCLEVLALQYAAACVGAIVSPINLDQRDRVGTILHSADHRLVFVGSRPEEFAATHALDRNRVVDVRDSRFHDEVAASTPVDQFGVIVSPDDPVLVLYTSGTTGSPKGAMLAPRGLFTGALALQEGFQLTGRDRFLLVNPLYHINSIAFCLALLGVGARIAMPPFAGHWTVAVAERITATSMVQRHLTPLLNPSGPADRHNADLFAELQRGGSLRWIAVGSGPLAPEVQSQFLDRGVLILFRWGMSENHLGATNMRPGHDWQYYRDRIGSTGPTNRYLNVFVIDDQGSRLVSGRGRLVQRGCVLVAYSTPDANEGVFAGGVHDTGDIAEITPEGHVYIVGRTKETILRSGENIYPQDVD
ncbi:MAG TPA: class I adenylate-forming enzyme family protein, partial [Chloroflexota bacterium]|nr:class I adenylate-forming enzyme family protein [Chloroflexota bacterium]